MNPTGNRFIELYNSGDNSVDLTGWYIQRKTINGTSFSSLVSKTYLKDISIDSKGYLLISKNSLSNTNVIVDNLTLTKSNTIQIKNSNKKIVDKVGWGDVTDCGNICAPNPPEGKSIQRTSNGNWIIGVPTTGKINQSTDNSGIGNNNSSNTNQNENSDVQIIISQEQSAPRKIMAKIISPKIIFAQTPFLINASITTNKEETLKRGKFKWNFGDGTISSDNNSKEFKHIYYYPGEYVISLNYWEYGGLNPDVSDRIIVNVIPSEISISSTGPKNDPFVELENKSNREMNLSGWIITAGIKKFTIPQGTIILAKGKLKLSPVITNFKQNDLNFILLTNPEGKIIIMYPKQKIKTPRTLIKSWHTYKKLAVTKKSVSNIDPPIIDLNKLGASAAGSSNTDYPWSAYSYFGLGFIILIGISSILFLQKKDNSIDYLKKDIRAEDINIIE